MAAAAVEAGGEDVQALVLEAVQKYVATIGPPILLGTAPDDAPDFVEALGTDCSSPVA